MDEHDIATETTTFALPAASRRSLELPSAVCDPSTAESVSRSDLFLCERDILRLYNVRALVGFLDRLKVAVGAKDHSAIVVLDLWVIQQDPVRRIRWQSIPTIG